MDMRKILEDERAKARDGMDFYGNDKLLQQVQYYQGRYDLCVSLITMLRQEDKENGI